MNITLLIVNHPCSTDRYRDLRLGRNLAQENLQTSELNVGAAMGWDGVGDPWYLRTTSGSACLATGKCRPLQEISRKCFRQRSIPNRINYRR
jgi:hypothetical protein